MHYRVLPREGKAQLDGHHDSRCFGESVGSGFNPAFSIGRHSDHNINVIAKVRNRPRLCKNVKSDFSVGNLDPQAIAGRKPVERGSYVVRYSR